MCSRGKGAKALVQRVGRWGLWAVVVVVFMIVTVLVAVIVGVVMTVTMTV